MKKPKSNIIQELLSPVKQNSNPAPKFDYSKPVASAKPDGQNVMRRTREMRSSKPKANQQMVAKILAGKK